MTALSAVTVITVVAIVVCAILAVRAARLLVSALWLAGTSAAVSLLLYMLGAPEVAVIELSVGAGLVTVLFVFAINIAGDEPLPARSRVPRPVAWVVTLASLSLLAVFTLPRVGVPLPLPEAERFATALWEHRAADVLLQVALMFTGVLGTIGLLADNPAAGDDAAGHHQAAEPREPVGASAGVRLDSLDDSGELRRDLATAPTDSAARRWAGKKEEWV